MKRLNIEIKAKCSDHDKIRSVLKLRQADFKGADHQIDTYFKVNNGRLKLREGNIENFLVFYEREDKEGPKQSNVILFKPEPDSSLKDILLASLGSLVVIDKQREIYFIENIKFHIDTVENLGTFMEIEAIDVDGTLGKEKLLEQCESYLELFSIPKSDLISVSYSDLLLQKKHIMHVTRNRVCRRYRGFESPPLRQKYKLYTHTTPTSVEVETFQHHGWHIETMMPEAYKRGVVTQQWGLVMENTVMRIMRVKRQYFNTILEGTKPLDVRVDHDNIKKT